MVEKYRKYPYKTKFNPHPELSTSSWSWYAFYRENGVKKRASLRTKNERIAEKKFQELLERLDKGILGFSLKPRPLPFKDFAKVFLEEATADLSQSSVLRHRQNLFGLKKDFNGEYKERQGHLVRFFRSQNLKSIGVKRISKYISYRQKEQASPNTILKELATLSSIFRFSMTEELIIFNPVLAVKKPKLKQVRPNYTPTLKEIELILQYLFPGAVRFLLAFCNSGCRKAELVNCNIRDADLINRMLRVRGKGDKERFLPMNEKLVEVMKEEIESRPNVRPDDPLFLNRENRRYQSLRGVLNTACKEAGVPHVTHHSFRHAYASLQHKRGVDEVKISKLLGHANPTITRNIYIHIFDEGLREAAEGFKIEAKKSHKSIT